MNQTGKRLGSTPFSHLVEIQRRIQLGTLSIPGKPEATLQVRRLVASEAGPGEVAHALGKDPALAAHVLKVANSASHRGLHTMASVNAAVSRLGINLTGVLVTHYALMQMAHAVPAKYRQRISHTYQHSLEVAAYCRALAVCYTRISPDDAMLAGLVHDIGALPVLAYAVRTPDLAESEERLEQTLRAIHAPVGAAILRRWHFPLQIVEAVARHEDWRRMRETVRPDLADLVIAANLDVYRYTEHPMATIDEASISALERIGLQPGIPFTESPAFREALQEAQALLG
ncbi:MAG: HDOD domain-containing protein [Ectothiorhodospiraceae bacterium]|nr:HDOD domain-containing protein [Ectothiorhodospiraceae bacterium]MCH8504584.1 HDOD domain-containing protein [Ectothiorhodospiraceae bacterium]